MSSGDGSVLCCVLDSLIVFNIVEKMHNIPYMATSSP